LEIARQVRIASTWQLRAKHVSFKATTWWDACLCLDLLTVTGHSEEFLLFEAAPGARPAVNHGMTGLS
jgi:hypothetical protein